MALSVELRESSVSLPLANCALGAQLKWHLQILNETS